MADRSPAPADGFRGSWRRRTALGLTVFATGILAGVLLSDAPPGPDGSARSTATAVGPAGPRGTSARRGLPSTGTADPRGRRGESGPSSPTEGGGDAGGANASPSSGSAGRSFTSRLADPASDSTAGSPRHTAIVAAVRRVIPSVVSVTVLRRQQIRGPFDFWVPRGYERIVKGLGSGFVIDENGYVLTNQHVVRGAVEVVVVDREGRSHEARVVGASELLDIAVLKISAGAVSPAPLGTSVDLLVGEPAIAVGNPYGYLLASPEPTVTAGVISAVGRDIRPEGTQEALYADMVQTDASINPGNSGGPLVNAVGQVVGVNSSMFSPSRGSGSVGLGFAIPIDRAVRIADELRAYGRIRRPWVGLDLREDARRDRPRGLVVARVAEGSPADEAGFRPGDVVLSVDGERVSSALDWEVKLVERGVGSTTRIRYRREGESRTVSLQVRELPSERAARVQVLRGLELVTVTSEIAAERDLPVEEGALIVEIGRRVSSRTGMRAGDVILSINRQRVEEADEAAELFRYYGGRGLVAVRLLRDGNVYLARFMM